MLSVAAFTMTTCLLLGLVSMAAVGATRAIVGGGDAPADETAAVVTSSDDEAGDGAPATGARSSRSEGSAKSASRSGPSRTSAKSRTLPKTGGGRRAGGAVAPADALRGAGAEEDGS